VNPREFAAPHRPGLQKIQTVISTPEISIGYKQFELRKRQTTFPMDRFFDVSETEPATSSARIRDQ
jgi:hypothetical protein